MLAPYEAVARLWAPQTGISLPKPGLPGLWIHLLLLRAEGLAHSRCSGDVW